MAYSDLTTWPVHFQTGVVYANGIVDITGAPIVGSISFTPRATVIGVINDAVLVFAATITKPLDASGSFSVELPATDDPDTQPRKWTYKVVENWPNGRTYDMKVLAGTTRNLLDLSPLQASIGIVQYIGPPGPQGPAGTGVTVIDGGAPAGTTSGDIWDGGTP